jgi:hypothetical protein
MNKQARLCPSMYPARTVLEIGHLVPSAIFNLSFRESLGMPQILLK